jgi:cytochrome c oxidase subunit IV
MNFRGTQQLWVEPAIVWLVLIVLFALSLGSAYLPLGNFNVALNLIIAAIMIVLLLAFLMDLRHSGILLRLFAGAGFLWTIFMFALTFTDYLSRHY